MQRTTGTTRSRLRRRLVLSALAVLLALPAAATAAPHVVVLKDGTKAGAAARAHGISPGRTYSHALSGYAADLSKAQVRRISGRAEVLSVVADVSFRRADWTLEGSGTKEADYGYLSKRQEIPASVRRVGGPSSPTADIDGVDERVDADVAILDDGVDTRHDDLNVAGKVNCIGKKFRAEQHGTQVAGSLAALDNQIGIVGVAPGARIWSVRVFDENGRATLSSVLCGVDWLTSSASFLEVANMSFEAPGTDDGQCGRKSGNAFHAAVCRAVGAGVTVVAAAGNASADAANTVPASLDEVIAVSGLVDYDGLAGGLGSPTCRDLGPDDSFAFFSNFGRDIDIAAPATCTLSTWVGDDYGVSAGTSFAAPHVAGAAALLLAGDPGTSPAEVRSQLLDGATPGPIAGDPDKHAEGVLDVSGL